MAHFNLPSNSGERKTIPLYSGVMCYFPDALIGVAKVSHCGNIQHNPGEPLHWAKHKSTDHGDCIQRHLLDFEKIDSDGMLHVDKLAWRALALAQMVHEAHAKGMRYVKYIEQLKTEAADVSKLQSS